MDGDGVKTGTGWVKGDDGLLVLDRNGNGVIDDGSELFGDQTLLSNGQKAANGLAALADLDSNGDGVFDSLDEYYSQVKIWRDLNQDGISQADELISLADAGIASINLTGSTSNTDFGNGNTQTANATYTRTDGTTGTVGNLNLAANSFYREFKDSIALTDEAKTLPGMRGAWKGCRRNSFLYNRHQREGAPRCATFTDSTGTWASNDAQWKMAA